MSVSSPAQPTGNTQPAVNPPPTGDSGTSTKATKAKTRRRGWAVTPYLFLAPFAVVFVGFVLIPAIYGFYISLHNYASRCLGSRSSGSRTTSTSSRPVAATPQTSGTA